MLAKDMTRGNPLQQILFFALPVMLANVCQQCYRIADAAVVGRCLGDTALGAVGGASEPLLFVVISFFCGLATGMPVVTGQCFGAKDYINVRRSIALNLLLGCGLSLPLMITAGFTTHWMLELMNTPEGLRSGASYYMMILFFCGTINVFLIQLSAVIRVLGDGKTPLYFMIFSAVLNVGLNVLFVAVFDWGIPGVAWATVSAQMIPAAICYLYFCKKMPQFAPRFSDFRLDWKFVKEHLRVGLPAGFQTLVVALGSLIVQYAVNDFDDVAVSGISSVAPLLGLVYMPLFAFHAALTTFCSQNFGARNLRRIIVGTRRTALLVVIYTLSATTLVFLCAPFLATLFLGSNANPDVVWHGVRFMRLLSPFFVVLGVIFLTYPPLVGMGYTMLSFWGGIVELVCRMTGALLLARLIGFNGACLSHPLAWFGSAALGVVCYICIISKLKREGIPDRIERATA